MRYIICQRCGQLLNSQEMFCPTCGLKVKSIKGIWRTLWMFILCVITLLFTMSSETSRAWMWKPKEHDGIIWQPGEINFDYPNGIKFFFIMTILLLTIAVVMVAVDKYFYSMLFVMLFGIFLVIGDFYLIKEEWNDIRYMYYGYLVLEKEARAVVGHIGITGIDGTLVHILCVGMLLFSIGICTIDTTNPKKKYMTRVFDVLAAATTLFAVIVTVRDIVCKF